MKRLIVQLTLREMLALFSDKRLWMAFGAIVALFVFTGPFGTIDRLGFAERLGFWLTVHFVTWSIALTGVALVSAWNGENSRIGIGQTIIGCCLATPLIGFAVSLIRTLFLNEPITVTGVFWQMLQALPVAIIIGIVAYFFFQPAQLPSSDPERRDPDKRLMQRLPPEKRGELLYMSMQDHYVEIVTAKGRELVLLRLADAINEAGSTSGIQVHRSHWAAFAAIAKTRRAGGRTSVVMSDGTELPVSRTYAGALREAGFG
ncbi:MAG: LytTR family DNA-binding domain-containing protein [Anderseniella sp.]